MSRDSVTLQSVPNPGEQSKVSKAWKVARPLSGIVLAFVALYAVSGRSDELHSVGNYLANVNWKWIIPGVVVELGSMVAFAAIQWSLVRSSGLNVRLTRLLGITFAGNSITNSLPAGPAFASFFAFRQYRRNGIDNALSGWILFGLFVASSITLAILAFVGLIVAVSTGSGSFGVANSIVISLVGALVFAAGAHYVLRKRHLVERIALHAIKASQKIFHRPRFDAQEKVKEIAELLHHAIPSRSDAIRALCWSMANWLLDLGCLITSYWALGVDIPWSGLLLAYGAGQLAANLPITPGGLGVVEGSLEVALVAFGGTQASTAAAILLYRLISFWLLLPIGWIWWIALHRGEARDARASKVSTGEPSAHQGVQNVQA